MTLWDERLHPRGQPENAGQFAEKPAVAIAQQHRRETVLWVAEM
jgi:hypothetical protein